MITITHIPDEPLFDEPLFAVGTGFAIGHFANGLWFGCWPIGMVVEWEESEWTVSWAWDWTHNDKTAQWIYNEDEQYGPTKNSPLSLIRLGGER